MSSNHSLTRTEILPQASPALITRLAKLGRVVTLAGTLAAVGISAMPATAHAGGPGVGAAIGLGILGGVIAGAAIAATAPPVYAAPPAYYYSPQSYYYHPAPYYDYYAAQPYYGSPAYSYSPYNYQ